MKFNKYQHNSKFASTVRQTLYKQSRLANCESTGYEVLMINV